MSIKEFLKPTIWKVSVSVIIPILLFLLNKVFFTCFPGPCVQDKFFGNYLFLIGVFLITYLIWSWISILIYDKKKKFVGLNVLFLIIVLLIILIFFLALIFARPYSISKMDSEGQVTICKSCVCYGLLETLESFPAQYNCKGINSCKDRGEC